MVPRIGQLLLQLKDLTKFHPMMIIKSGGHSWFVKNDLLPYTFFMSYTKLNDLQFY